MLRWTCRLRDVVETNQYKCKPHTENLSGMREVEFCRDVVFPETLRWETFKSFYGSGYVEVDIRSECDWRPVLAVDAASPTSQSIRALCGHVAWDVTTGKHTSLCKFDVLWLSPIVFISRLRVFVNGICPDDYQVTFTEVDGDDGVCFFIYQISSFDPESERGPPTSVPLAFFRHLTAFLPAGFFFEICLMNPERDFPVDFHLQLLFLIPHDAPTLSPSRKRRTTFELERVATVDELRQIFAHQFHPTVQLTFGYVPVLLNEFNHMIRESPHLRFVQMPYTLSRPVTSNDTIFVKEALLTGLQLSISCTGWISVAVLHSLATFHGIIDIKVEFYSDEIRNPPQRPFNIFRSCVEVFVCEGSALERLQFHFIRGHCLERSAIMFSPCMSRKLSCFNISCDEPAGGQAVSHVQQWDIDLFPSVTLNCYFNHLKKRLVRGMLPLAVKAINEGHVYHRSTNHVAFNMNIANAGVIFCIIRAQGRRDAGLGSFPLEGPPNDTKKRAASNGGPYQRNQVRALSADL
jgi:hypothetical protein